MKKIYLIAGHNLTSDSGAVSENGIREADLTNYSKSVLDKKFKGLIQPEDYKLIPLTQGKFAKVDNEDFDKVKDINWCYTHGYVKNLNLGYLHRFINNTEQGYLTDHINGDGLDNRKSNLRNCSKITNGQNSRKRKNTSSKLKGVSLNKNSGLYESYITKNKKRISLGYFRNEIEAAKAYDKKATELFGEFARLNNV